MHPVIARAREILGPNGEHWIKGDFSDGKGGTCLQGALSLAVFDQRNPSWLVGLDDPPGSIAVAESQRIFRTVKRLVQEADLSLPLGRVAGVMTYNDHPDTAWADIDRLLTELDEALAIEEVSRES